MWLVYIQAATHSPKLTLCFTFLQPYILYKCELPRTFALLVFISAIRRDWIVERKYCNFQFLLVEIFHIWNGRQRCWLNKLNIEIEWNLSYLFSNMLHTWDWIIAACSGELRGTRACTDIFIRTLSSRAKSSIEGTKVCTIIFTRQKVRLLAPKQYNPHWKAFVIWKVLFGVVYLLFSISKLCTISWML